MDQEQLIRQIMAEVMKNVGGEATETPAPATRPPDSGKVTVGVGHYPLAQRHPELVVTDTGLGLDELTFDKLTSGQLTPADFKISAETLELQAQIAEDSGRGPLARNMRRAAELVRVPDERLLDIYNALRPYRSTKAELCGIADELEGTYGATISAGFVREAAEVYEARGRLRVD